MSDTEESSQPSMTKPEVGKNFITKILTAEDLNPEGLDSISREEEREINKDRSEHFKNRVNHSLEKINKLEELVGIDGLTKLDNRLSFDTKLSDEFARSSRYGHNLSLVMIDIDNFKRINDTYGHQVGDLVLQKISALLQKQIRSQIDVAARYGGEELALILPETTEINAEYLGNRIREIVENQKISLPDGREISVTITMGISNGVKPDKSIVNSPEEMIASADQALYIGKKIRGGEKTKNQVVSATSITTDELMNLQNLKPAT